MTRLLLLIPHLILERTKDTLQIHVTQNRHTLKLRRTKEKQERDWSMEVERDWSEEHSGWNERPTSVTTVSHPKNTLKETSCQSGNLHKYLRWKLKLKMGEGIPTHVSRGSD